MRPWDRPPVRGGRGTRPSLRRSPDRAVPRELRFRRGCIARSATVRGGIWGRPEHTSYALSEELCDDEACFDGLAQTDFVGQDAASFRNAAEREDDGVYLVRVRVDSTAPLSSGIASVLIGASQACKVFGEQPTMD